MASHSTPQTRKWLVAGLALGLLGVLDLLLIDLILLPTYLREAEHRAHLAKAPAPAPTPKAPAPTPTPTPKAPAPTPTPAPKAPAPTPTPAPKAPAPTPTPTPKAPAPTPTPTPKPPAPTAKVLASKATCSVRFGKKQWWLNTPQEEVVRRCTLRNFRRRRVLLVGYANDLIDAGARRRMARRRALSVAHALRKYKGLVCRVIPRATEADHPQGRRVDLIDAPNCRRRR